MDDDNNKNTSLLLWRFVIGNEWNELKVSIEQHPPKRVSHRGRQTGRKMQTTTICKIATGFLSRTDRAKVILLPVCYFNFSVALFRDNVAKSTFNIKLNKIWIQCNITGESTAFCHSIRLLTHFCISLWLDATATGRWFHYNKNNHLPGKK